MEMDNEILCNQFYIIWNEIFILFFWNVSKNFFAASFPWVRTIKNAVTMMTAILYVKSPKKISYEIFVQKKGMKVKSMKERSTLGQMKKWKVSFCSISMWSLAKYVGEK